MNAEKMTRRLRARFGETLSVRFEDRVIRVTGQLSNWEDIVSACSMCVSKKPGVHVVNDILFTGAQMPDMRVPALKDKALDGARPDVLIIGGGISGASIARELTRWQLDVLLVDKEADLAMHASGRNDGEVHPGVDLNKGSLKQHYVLLGNQMFDTV